MFVLSRKYVWRDEKRWLIYCLSATFSSLIRLLRAGFLALSVLSHCFSLCTVFFSVVIQSLMTVSPLPFATLWPRDPPFLHSSLIHDTHFSPRHKDDRRISGRFGENTFESVSKTLVTAKSRTK